MADDNSTKQTETETGQTAGASARAEKLEHELGEELTRLGQSFVEVVRVAWNSDQRRQLERDLKTGLNSVAAGLEDGFKKVSESPQTKEFVDQAEDVAESVGEKVRKSEVAQEIGAGLLKGLRALSVQLDKLTSELQDKDVAGSGDKPSPTPPQDIPINKE
ncbi:MAG TPA: hypothetical protein PKE45_11480 [Caldilineaceae bacterium]|nr:hypothetical protein [Caldilineaceae bacterium]